MAEPTDEDLQKIIHPLYNAGYQAGLAAGRAEVHAWTNAERAARTPVSAARPQETVEGEPTSAFSSPPKPEDGAS